MEGQLEKNKDTDGDGETYTEEYVQRPREKAGG